MSKTSKKADKQLEENIAQFCGITGASAKDAKAFLAKFKRLDVAIDNYYSDPHMFRRGGAPAETGPSTSKLNALFDQYKDADGDIGVDGTIKMCEDLGVNPEDVVLLALAFELKSPQMGMWTRKGYVDGWKALGTDSLAGQKTALARMRDKLASDPPYFVQVYGHTFDFGRSEGQRSLGLEMALGFWQLLLPFGLEGGALSQLAGDDDGDEDMEGGEGWQAEYTQWWFDFLQEKGHKGVSKDTWTMFLEFVRTIDSRFERYDMEAAWPSAIDDFVEYAKERLAK